MRRISLIALLWLFASSLSLAQQMNKADNPCSRYRSTAETFDCYDRQFTDADAEMNVLYKRIRGVLESSESTLLIKAQRLWIQYRDASCEAQYAAFGGGTGGPIARVACQADLTRERIRSLHLGYDWRLDK
jgi:uncharacterized protein YecT (DUF1311 family)